MVHLALDSGLTSYSNPEFTLQFYGEEEANRYKWIASQQANRDLGETGIIFWIDHYWPKFLRYRRLEHLKGERFWPDLDHADFGRLSGDMWGLRFIHPIIERFLSLDENLPIIWWAERHCTEEECEQILRILEVLDMNCCRIQAKFDPRQHPSHSAVA